MKCPACGYWNRASYPCCFRCSQELSQAQRQSQALPADELEKTGSLSSDRPTQIRYDEYGNEFVGVDENAGES
jgi:hypothetical protein